MALREWKAFLPYVNTTKDAADAITASVLLNRVKKGEELTEKQTEILVDYLRDLKELQVRGFTFGGGTVNAILTSIPYLEEFGIGLAASESGVGLASLAKTISTIGGKRAARKAVEKALKDAAIKSAAPAAVKTTVPLSAAKSIYRNTLAKTSTAAALKNITAREALSATGKALPQAVASSTKFALTKMPHNFVGGIADKQFSTGVYVTDYGDAVFTSSEHLATSIMKALGESTFEALTETAGWTFSPVVSYFAKPIQKVMPKKFFTEFEKLVTSRYGMPAAQALKKYGYDGVIEEMGEELLNRFLCQVFGINGLDEYNFDGFMNNVLYANNPSQWGQEFLSFAAISGAGHTVAGTQSKITEEWNKRQYQKKLSDMADKANKYIYSPEQFYLEQGLIKIKGSQSLAEQKLRDVWSSHNIDESLQNDVLKNMSESEIRAELKKEVQNQSIDASPEAATERIVKDLTSKFIDNKIFSNEKSAKSVATLFATPLQKLSEVTGQSLKDIMEEEMPEIKRSAEQAVEENGINIAIENAINERMDALNALPDDYSDEAYIQSIIDDIEILEKIGSNTLTQEETQKANEVMQRLGITQNNNEEMYQAIDEVGIKNIEDNFNDTVENITEYISGDIRNILVENNITPEEFNFEDIRIYGSYSTGQNNENSDLDFLVQYSGSMREDDAFNMFHEEELTISDKNGNPVVIDINPINVDKSGTIDDKLQQMNTLFQTVETAGIENSADISAAKKEWQEKGIESKYFKKWFSGSKVVDESGKPLVVYHGSPSHDITIFDSGKSLYGEISKGFNFFTNKKSAYQNSAKDYAEFAGTDGFRRNGKVYETYLKIQKPLHIKYTSNAMTLYNGGKQYATPVEYYDTNYKEIKEKYNNGDYDGIIIENTDKNNDDSIIYLVSNPEQIKSVNNQGTFDAENSNIYYQSAYHGTPHRFERFSLDAIGTGEGAQAHGWGLYFAGEKSVSEQYRKRLSSIGSIGDRNIWKYRNKEYELIFNEDENEVEILGEISGLKDYEVEILKAFYDASGRTEDEIFNDIWSEINDTIEELEIEKNTAYSKELEKLYKQREMLDNEGFPQRAKQSEGQLFEVNIPEKKFNLL